MFDIFIDNEKFDNDTSLIVGKWSKIFYFITEICQ